MLIKPVAVILDRRALTFGKFKIRINPLMMMWPEIVFTNSANFTKKNCSKSAMRHLRSSTSHFPCLFPIKFTSIKTFANFFCNLVQTKHNRIRKQTLLTSKFISAPFTGLKKLKYHSKREILVVLLREGNGCNRNLQVPVPTQQILGAAPNWSESQNHKIISVGKDLQDYQAQTLMDLQYLVLTNGV